MTGFTIGDDFVAKLEDRLRKELDKKRYLHTLSVAYTAANMAMAYGADFHKAYIAGLLHDNAKCIPAKKKLSLCKKFKLSINDAEQANPELLHAKLGSCLAYEDYGITDPEILDAILYHTTGKPAMSLMEKIVYIADYIEPRRKPQDNMEIIRKYAYTDIDRALYLILQNTIYYLTKKDAAIDPLTLETLEFYKREESK